MLYVLFHNDSTGTDTIGNYEWSVYINSVMLASGKLKGHKRMSGWEGLVCKFAKSLKKKGKEGK